MSELLTLKFKDLESSKCRQNYFNWKDNKDCEIALTVLNVIDLFDYSRKNGLISNFLSFTFIILLSRMC